MYLSSREVFEFPFLLFSSREVVGEVVEPWEADRKLVGAIALQGLTRAMSTRNVPGSTLVSHSSGLVLGSGEGRETWPSGCFRIVHHMFNMVGPRHVDAPVALVQLCDNGCHTP